MREEIKTKTWEVLRSTARQILPITAIMFMGALPGLAVYPANAAERGWGPERPTYVWKKPADHPTFNSMTDNPSIGDERNFVRLKKVGTEDKYLDGVDLEVGAEYEVAIFYHNNASAGLNGTGRALAENVRLRVEQPELVREGQAAEIKGIISSTNATPKEVWDTAYARAKTTVLMRYVANSATIHNAGNANGKILSSEAMFGKDGAKLAHSTKYWGYIPGCNEYAGYVTYRFKVDKPGFSISKTVSKDKEQNYVENITVKPGDVLDFKIDYKNTGTTIQQDIKAYDHMPEGLEYVSGTTFMKASFNKEGNFVSDKLFNGGINLGDTRPKDEISLTYKVEVKDDKKLFPCGEKKIYNNASIATNDGTSYDKVEITVRRNCDTTIKELPKAGPTEIVLSLVVISGISIGTTYYFASRRQLKNLEK